MVAVVDEKIAFGRDQVISSTQASKNFGEVRRRAKKTPLFVTDKNASIDTVIIGYDEFEQMAVELDHLRQQVVYAVVSQRIAEADANPAHCSLALEDVLDTKAYQQFMELDPGAESDEELFE